MKPKFKTDLGCFFPLLMAFMLSCAAAHNLAHSNSEIEQKDESVTRTIDFGSAVSLGVVFVFKNAPNTEAHTVRVTAGRFAGKALSKLKVQLKPDERICLAVSRFCIENPTSLTQITPLSLDAILIDRFGSDDEVVEDPRLSKFIASLSKRAEIKEFYIDKTTVTDAQLSKLSQFRNLERFSSSLNPSLNGSCLEKISQCTKLILISFWFSNFRPQNLAYLSNLKSLRTLKLSHNNLANGMHFMPPLATLIELDLNRSHINDEDVRQLTKLKNIQNLSLSFCPITDKSFEFIAQMPKLKSISLQETKITDAGLISFLRRNRTVRRVTVSDGLMTNENKMISRSLLSGVLFVPSSRKGLNEETQAIFAPISKNAGL